MHKFLTHIPQELINKKAKCLNCGMQNDIDWLRKTNEPMGSVVPNDFHPESNNKIWVQTAFSIPCKSCNHNVIIPLPSNKKSKELLLYGDEAYDPAQFIFTYSLVGADKRIIPKIENATDELKREFEPNVEPRSWTLHMKSIWSSKERQKHPIYKAWNFQKVHRLLGKFTALIRNFDNEMFIYNISLTKNHQYNNDSIDNAKYNSYLMLILNVVEEATSLKRP